MDLLYFHKLSLGQRFALVFYSGECIATHRSFGNRTSSYAFQHCYIEMTYTPGTNHIEKIEIIDPMDERLMIYTSTIILKDLL